MLTSLTGWRFVLVSAAMFGAIIAIVRGTAVLLDRLRDRDRKPLQ
jgi:hypothetical protein